MATRDENLERINRAVEAANKLADTFAEAAAEASNAQRALARAMRDLPALLDPDTFRGT